MARWTVQTQDQKKDPSAFCNLDDALNSERERKPAAQREPERGKVGPYGYWYGGQPYKKGNRDVGRGDFEKQG